MGVEPVMGLRRSGFSSLSASSGLFWAEGSVTPFSAAVFSDEVELSCWSVMTGSPSRNRVGTRLSSTPSVRRGTRSRMGGKNWEKWRPTLMPARETSHVEKE